MESKDKKVTSTKPAAIKEEAVVKAAVKEEPVAKEVKPAEEPAAVQAEKKAEPEKKDVQPEAKEAPAKKGKPGRKPGKTAAKKKPTERVEEVYVQFQELEITTKELLDKAKQIYIADGHRESSIKSLRLYIKPDEHMAYYVINDKMTGGIEL
ncbi:MAG: hypothetical protein HFH36_05985 [Lachnospiraceae bacterium]|nr:hypothetical protein [Lachnospiraceae bacterium]